MRNVTNKTSKEQEKNKAQFRFRYSDSSGPFLLNREHLPSKIMIRHVTL